jgi:ferritin
MQTATATAKPTYLGLLNAISLAETSAGVYLSAWADATPNEELACVLRLVAARETSHGQLFCRQLQELGYDVRKKSDPQAAKRLAKYGDPEISDLEKVGPERPRNDNEFADIERRLADGEFDPMTANLITWYIAEERDSGARLREAYARVRAGGKPARKANGHAAADDSSPGADAQAIMACMTAGFSRLEKSLEKLAKAVK